MVTSRIASIIVTAIAVAAIAGGLLALAVAVVPRSSGAILAGSTGGFTAEGAEVATLPGARTTLRTGDIVTAIDGWTLDGPSATSAGTRPIALPGADRVAASVVRDGRSVDLEVQLAPYPIADMLVANLGTLSFVVLLFVLAVFVFARRPRDAAAQGLLLLAVGAVGSTPAFLAGVDPLAFARGTVWVSLGATVLVYFLLWGGSLHFALTFPRAHPVVLRHPRVVALPYVLVFGSLGLAVPVSIALSEGGLSALAIFNAFGGLVTLVTLLGTAGLMLAAWRRADPDERRMLRAVIVAASFAIFGAMALMFVPELLVGRPLLPWSFAAVVGIPLVLALASAVLRHHAFDIDTVVDRSLVYGGLTLVVIGVYVGAVTVLGALLIDSADYAVTLSATAVAALAALPARDLLQRAVDRALYGDRRDPVRAIRRLGRRLASALDPSAIPGAIVTTVADALRVPYVALEVGVGPSARVAADRGAPPTSHDLVVIELVSHSAPIGRLLVAPRTRGEPLSPEDLRLLEDLARQAGPAVESLALEEALRRSRERIVLAGEEERRRLRRDLHDGLGPTLAGIGMRADAAAADLARDPEAAARALAGIRSEVDTAVADVGRLVEGLRPPALDELGLVGAIEQQAARLGGETPRFVIEAPADLGELPAAVEVAAYRIAVEAMTNVVRHAGASRCHVRLEADAPGLPRLDLVVRDDGRGLAAHPVAGVGLTSMRERAAEVGGEVRVEAGTAGGTVIRARLPMASS